MSRLARVGTSLAGSTLPPTPSARLAVRSHARSDSDDGHDTEVDGDQTVTSYSPPPFVSLRVLLLRVLSPTNVLSWRIKPSVTHCRHPEHPKKNGIPLTRGGKFHDLKFPVKLQ